MKFHTEIITSVKVSPSLLILVAGFEERCIGCLDLVENIDLSNSNLVLLHYKRHSRKIDRLNRINEIKIRQRLKSKVKSFISIELDHLNPLKTLKRIKKIFSNMDRKDLADIIFDVSVCFDGLIPILILYLISIKPSSLSFIYTRPKMYNLVRLIGRKDNSENLNLTLSLKRHYKMTSGLSRVDYFEGFEGLPNPLLPYIIIFSAGFELNKVEAVCRRFEDARKIVLFGRSKLFDSTNEENLSRDLHSTLSSYIQYEQNVIENFRVEHIVETLLCKIKSLPNANIILCCFGTKPQLIANTFIALKLPENALMRVLLRNYDPRYFSEGKADSLLISVDDLEEYHNAIFEI